MKKILKTKVIKNMDDKTWTKFTAHCKAEGEISAQLLTKILKDYLKKSIKAQKQIIKK